MSDRIVYKRVPLAKRICSYYLCPAPAQQIRRNIARTKDGKLWHWGCLQTARDEQWRCLECYTVFDATQCTFEEGQKIQGDEVTEDLKVLCPECGGMNIKSLHGARVGRIET